MDSYKEKLKEIAYNKSTYDSISTIASKYSLHIDQLGELTAEVRDILMGFRSSKKFTSDIIDRLEIDKELANKITVDVNIILEGIMKDNIKPADTNTSDINTSAIEKAGGFNLEENEGNVNDENTTQSIADLSTNDVTEADKDTILQGIENPTPSTPVPIKKINLLEDNSTHTDPIIDHLLSTPIATQEKKVEKIATETPKVSIQTVRPSGPDKYREPVE